MVSEAIKRRRLLALDYYKANEDEFTERTVEPYALINGREGWYVASYDPAKDDVRHFRLDRIKRGRVTRDRFEPRPEVDPAADVEGWPRTGEVEASRTRARVDLARARPLGARGAPVAQELADGAVVVELPFAGADFLVREVLKEAGDAAVLEPEDAREAVLEAVAGACVARPSASALITTLRPVSRRDQITMSDDEVARFLAGERVVTCASFGPRGWPHLMPLWYVVRATGTLWSWTYAKSQKVRNLERDARVHAADRGRAREYHELRGVMFECDVDDPPRHRDRRGRSAWSSSRRYGGRRGRAADEVARRRSSAGRQARRPASSSSAAARPGTTASSGSVAPMQR